MTQISTIRLANVFDPANLLDIYGPIVEGTIISLEHETPTIEEFAERIQAIIVKTPWLICEIDNKIAGYAYAAPHRTRDAYKWTVEFSAYVSKNQQRKGIGRCLYVSLTEILRIQGYHNALAGIALPNEVSIAFHESLSFTKIGIYHKVGYKLGAWHDVGWWELEINNISEPPGKPLTLDEVQNHKDWEKALNSGIEFIKS